MVSRAKVMPPPANTTGMVTVTDGVYAYIGGNGQTNFGLVTTNDKPVIIDNDIRVRKPFIAGMRRITRKEAGLVLNTHHNFDHTADNAYYTKRGAISFGADIVRKEMEREFASGNWVKQMDGRGPTVRHLIGKLDIAPPMVTFENQIDICYGGQKFQMIYIDHCHTKGDAVVWMPERGVLFSGDLITYRTHVVNRLGNFLNWISALSALKKFPVKYIIPGHGPLPPRGGGAIDEVKLFLTRLKNRTKAALIKHGTPAKAAPAVQMPEYQKWFRSQNVHNNALKMARELKKNS